MNSKLNRVLENLKNIATLKDYFNDYLNLFFKGNLENLHNIFSIDNVGDSIEEISRQETCAFFYNSIKGSKGFKYRNDDHKKFVNNRDFFLHYHNLGIEVINKLGFKNKKFLIQKIPTLRVQFPGINTSKIKHIDSDFGHPKGEINFWVPLTPIKPSQNIWFEIDGKDICHELFESDCIVFDGEIPHFTKKNVEQKTRFSFDFRIISHEDFNSYDQASKSLSSGISFKDNYFTNLKN